MWLPDIFDDFFDNRWMARTNATAPAINVIETAKEYRVEVAAPGMTRDDFNVRINEANQLVVTMERRSESGSEAPDADKAKATKKAQKEWEKVDKAIEKGNEGRYLRREFSYTHFQQAMVLPDNIKPEKISANMDNGVRHITIPKTAPHPEAAKERLVEIK